TFGVRRDVTEEHEGEVSTVLHDEVEVGATLFLSAPVGGFGLANKDHRQLFIGSGVGVTPLVSMYKEAVDSDSASTFLQSTSDAQDRAFDENFEASTAKSSV